MSRYDFEWVPRDVAPSSKQYAFPRANHLVSNCMHLLSGSSSRIRRSSFRRASNLLLKAKSDMPTTVLFRPSLGTATVWPPISSSLSVSLSSPNRSASSSSLSFSAFGAAAFRPPPGRVGTLAKDGSMMGTCPPAQATRIGSSCRVSQRYCLDTSLVVLAACLNAK